MKRVNRVIGRGSEEIHSRRHQFKPKQGGKTYPTEEKADHRGQIKKADLLMVGREEIFPDSAVSTLLFKIVLSPIIHTMLLKK